MRERELHTKQRKSKIIIIKQMRNRKMLTAIVERYDEIICWRALKNDEKTLTFVFAEFSFPVIEFIDLFLIASARDTLASCPDANNK